MRWILLALAGCTAMDDPALDDVEVSQVVSFDYGFANGINWTASLDLLIVVDRSLAMAPHRDRLVDSYRRFDAALEYAPGLLPDLHLGVVTADADGVFRRAPSVSGDYIVDRPISSTERSINYGGSLGDAIAQLADAGSDGSATSRPIDAMRLAFETDNGFRRPDAYLLVVFIAATDDASNTTIEEAATLLQSLDDDAAVSLIAAPDGASCAAPATRLRELADQVVEESTFASICGTAHEDVLSILTNGVYRYNLALPCLGSLAVPFECAVEDAFSTPDGDRQLRLGACDDDATSRPCWRFEPYEYGCDGFVLHVERSQMAVLGTRTRGQCVASP